MNILIIGNDARTHAVAEAFLRSKQKVQLYAYMKSSNPGIASVSKKYVVGGYDNLEGIRAFALENDINFAFIGPEDPLGLGVVDMLAKVGIKAVGPVKSLARLETSKSFTRLLMKKYQIPGMPKFEVCRSKESVQKFIDSVEQFVVKPDGLTGGKGVMVQGDHFDTKDEGLTIALTLMRKDGMVVMEEKLIGEEFSLQSLCDGKHLLDFPPVQDHKRAFEDDQGPNTGGMGSYSTGKLLPFMKQKDLDEAHAITTKMADALHKETGMLYKGVMYGGFIITKGGVKLIEYNARFGDPEAMNVLPVMLNDFVEVCIALIEGTLDKIKPEFSDNATVCKYVVPEGYPSNPKPDQEIDISKTSEKKYYASVYQKDGKLLMTRSRAMAFVGVAETIAKAEAIAEKACSAVKGRVRHRTDIGTSALIQKRILHMDDIRSQ